MDRTSQKYTNEHTLLNPDVSGVFVVNNAKKRAFIEQFSHTSVNFTQKDLGTILGFFIVRDESPSSENIVNFLTSEIKKYYFSHTQKNVEEKFESTLHRINRALEELATLGNVNWLGTIDGAVCVIAHSSIHFSVTGNAHILLLRDNTLLNISEGLASEEASQYPLKTFVDISSGEINPHDKIIITSPELLDLISFEELQKNAVRMGQQNFIQFIETVLTNECMIASTTIIDINPISRAAIAEPTYKEVPRNFFGAPHVATPTQDQSETLPDEDILSYTEESPAEYTDPQTGHIYIHGATDPIEKPSFFDQFTENASDILDTVKEKTAKHRKSITKKISAIAKRKETETPSLPDHDEYVQDTFDTTFFSDEQVIAQEDVNLKKKILLILLHTKDLLKKTFLQCIALFSLTAKKITDAFMNMRSKTTSQPVLEEKVFDERSHKVKKISAITNILPRLGNITSLWRSMSTKTKWLALGIVACIVLVPLFFSFSEKKTTNTPTDHNTSTPAPQIPEVPSSPSPSHTQESVAKPRITDPQNIYQTKELSRISMVDDTPLSTEKKSVTIIDKDNAPKSFVLPGDAGSIIASAPMNDLDLIILITDKDQIYTFSPATKAFTKQENSPEIDHTKITHVGTYMTYLYIATTNTITRHTRVEGGFDAGKQWLRDSIDLSAVTDMAIGESIFLADKKALTSYSQGKKDSISFDPKIAQSTLLFTSDDAEFLWTVDLEKSTLFKVDKKSGTVVNEYMHTQLAKTTSFTVNEKSQTIYTTQLDGAYSYVLAE